MPDPRDTSIAGPSGELPDTRASAVFGLRSGDEAGRKQALEVLIAAYWKPVYKIVRRHWSKSNEDAKDLTQEFFSLAIEKDFFESFDPDRGRFRTFLVVCLKRFLSNADRAARRLKRGGGTPAWSLDFGAADEELAREPAAPENEEDYFEREWVRHLIAMAVDDVRTEFVLKGRPAPFQVFERYDLAPPDQERPTYEALAAEVGITPVDVTNYLHQVRKRLRERLLARLREITGSEEEYRDEVRAFFREPPG